MTNPLRNESGSSHATIPPQEWIAPLGQTRNLSLANTENSSHATPTLATLIEECVEGHTPATPDESAFEVRTPLPGCTLSEGLRNAIPMSLCVCVWVWVGVPLPLVSVVV